ncbi:hypothetical protein ACFTUC_18300 [Streptomyces sp. NPDC056944]|uniref:hypothetical protein n=1 Tax=Streptomyces sp. NPDC056944 TaxID=3345972 RepID=UPI003645C2E4
MAEVTNEELSIQVAGLRHYLRKVDGGWLPTTDWLKQQLAPINKVVEDLKAQQDKAAEEAAKAPWEEWMETVGLGTLAEIIKSSLEGGIVGALGAIGTALAVIIVPVLLATLGAFIVSKIQTWHAGRNGGFTYAPDQEGVLRRQRLTDIQAQQNGGGGSLLDQIPADANFDNLRAQLQLLNPELLKFNNRAPSFIQSFRKLPPEGKATKAANAIKKIADAITGIDHGQMQPVAEGVNKINNAMRNADPRKVTKVARATDKLKAAMVGFDATKIPKSSDLGPAATKMGELATATGTLRTKLREFASTVRDLDSALGAPTA